MIGDGSDDLERLWHEPPYVQPIPRPTYTELHEHLGDMSVNLRLVNAIQFITIESGSVLGAVKAFQDNDRFAGVVYSVIGVAELIAAVSLHRFASRGLRMANRAFDSDPAVE